MNPNKVGLFGLSLLGLGMQNGTGMVAEKNAVRPNIVLILSDDQGWGDLAINGNLAANTPNINRIAHEGASFSNFYVCPVCSPTRSELLTGRYAVRAGVCDVSNGGERIDLDETTIADYFKKAGYATGAFGKWHSGTQYPYHPNARGFDEFYGFCSGHLGNYWNPMLDHNGEIVEGKGFITNDLTNRAIEYVKKNKEKPFFVYIPYNTPHSPMQVPDNWWNKYKNINIIQNATEASREDKTHTKAVLALSEIVDWNVGRMMETLKTLGLDDRTIIIYLSDNGPNGHRWNGGMKGVKGSTDEGGVRSPFFIRWKGKIQAGRNVEQLSSVVDLLPTLLDLAGVKPPLYNKPLDGVSLKSILLNNEDRNIDRTLFSHWGNKTAVRVQDYLLGSEGQLYNTKIDREQKNDISVSNPAMFEKLKKLLAYYNENILTELPHKDTRPFLLGHPKERLSMLPARDGKAHGGIERSNKFPNSSFFTNWTKTTDSITWNVEVVESGLFEAMVYYTCAPEDVGSVINLKIGRNRLITKLTKANDTPMLGADLDRVPRAESYEKGWIPFTLGNIKMDKGKTTLVIKADQIPHFEAMNLRRLVFRRIQ
ncbi:MAG: arylsulfatase [Bacteroidetes bacterium]|nr:arylsulfatase [Bacteroidota bacterium]